MVPPENVQVITKQLRGIVDLIWPQLLLEANIGALDKEEREDLVEHLKGQLTDVLTEELLRRLSKLLAEELYFEQEPLSQIERYVRQLVRDWAEVLNDIKKAGGRRKKRKITTVTLEEQRRDQVGAASSDFKVDRSGPVERRAEEAYEALRTALDKRIAQKALTVLARTAQISGEKLVLTVDSLVHAMGRFGSRLVDVLEVFALSGVVEVDPEGPITMDSLVGLSDAGLVEKWERMKEWIFGRDASDFSPDTGYDGSSSASQAAPMLAFDMNFVEEFGAAPSNASEFTKRAETVYESLVPSLRKRAAQRLLLSVAKLDPDNSGIGQDKVLEDIGRFESMIRDLIEYFIRQEILAAEGGLHFKDPGLPQNWDRLSKWIKEEK